MAKFRLFLFAVSCGSMLSAQDLRILDDCSLLAATCDPIRGRYVAVGGSGVIREFHGGHWHATTHRLDGVQEARTVFDPSTGEVVICLDRNLGSLQIMRYDGARLTQVAPGGPSPRRGYVCAFDTARGELIVHGGHATGPLPDTWVFDGLQWRLAAASSLPVDVSYASLAYDPVRGRTVLFGGFRDGMPRNGTFEWDGTSWSSIATPVVPSARGYAAMAYDTRRARMVMTGGDDRLAVVAPVMDDTWEYDGANWVQVSVTAMPVPDAASVMCYDPALSQVVLLHGLPLPTSALSPETFDGGRWQPIPASPHPGMRAGAVATAHPNGVGALILDDTRLVQWNGHEFAPQAGALPSARIFASGTATVGTAFVFGGLSIATGAPLGDLWRHDGASFRRDNATGPSPRARASLAYDLWRQRLVLFGGQDSNTILGDTWSFDGSSWQQHFPAQSPQPRTGAAMAYDLVRQVTVLCGGETLQAASRDMWNWDGSNWARVGGILPFLAQRASMTYDARALQLVVAEELGSNTAVHRFDGIRWSSVTLGLPSSGLAALGFPLADGVLLHTNAAIASLPADEPVVLSIGNPCGGAISIAADSWPRIGNGRFGLQVLHAPENATVALGLSVQTGFLSFGLCLLRIGSGPVFLLPTSGNGFARLAVPLPTATVLVGVELFSQAAAVSPVVPAGFVLSSAMRLRIGA